MGTDNQRTIEEWSEQLHHHFRTLQESRKGDEQRKVFALEHGLDESQRCSLSLRVSQMEIGAAVVRQGWLPLVVHAAEVGYTYDGNEYWQTFEEHTPRWKGNRRALLRRCFQKFACTYRGEIPSGRWAEHFRIIAWPITHAIIPTYIQQLFVEALYDLGMLLDTTHDKSAEEIGSIIQRCTATSSDRLGQFLQQTELTGRLVQALIHDHESEGSGLIYDKTMTRIVNDLNAEDDRRSKLRELRYRFKLARRTGSRLLRDDHEPAPQPSGGANFVPSIRLHWNESESKWNAWAHFSSCRGRSDGEGDIERILNSSRCQVSGSDRFLPQGWLLEWNPAEKLQAWPTCNEPTLHFESSDSATKERIEKASEYRQLPPWLFKVGGDGVAREIGQRFVRPGNKYVLVSLGRMELPENHMACESEVNCDGVEALKVEIPSKVSDDDREWLHEARLKDVETVSVWPAGLVCLGWDGEGGSRWWTTDEPCFGLESDHDIESVHVSLNAKNEVRVDMQSNGEPTFIRLPRLPSGRHELTIRAEAQSQEPESGTDRNATQRLWLDVEEPIPWRTHQRTRGAIRVIVDPDQGSLEHLWQGRSSLAVEGPGDVTVDLSVVLRRSNGSVINTHGLWSQKELPITSSDWHKALDQFARSEEHITEYLEAHAIEVEVLGGEFGRVSREFCRESAPLRWVPKRVGDMIHIRLVNDVDDDEGEPSVWKYCMNKPTTQLDCDVTSALRWFEAEAPGALYVAEYGGHRDVVVIDPCITMSRLEDIGVRPEIEEIGTKNARLKHFIVALTQWDGARLYGRWLVRGKLKSVTKAIWDAVYRALGCDRWGTAEAHVLEHWDSEVTHSALQRQIDEAVDGLGEKLIDAHRAWGVALDGLADEYAQIVCASGICQNEEVAKKIFWTGVAPSRIQRMSGDELSTVIECIGKHPALLLGARLLALYTTTHHDTPRSV